MQKINNKGFSVALTLIVTIVVLAIGGSAYFVWHKKHEPKGSQANVKKTTQSSSSKQAGDTKQQVTNDPSEGGKYLVIKEWRVRFQLPESLQGDMSYHFFDPDSAAYDPSTPTDLIRLISSKYSSVKNCGMEGGGYLSLFRDDVKVSEQTVPAKFKQIGQYNYYLSNTACSESTEFTGQVADDYAKLTESIKNTLTAY